MPKLLAFVICALLWLSLVTIGFSPINATGPALAETWGGKNNDAGNGVALDSSGNIIVAGESFSFGSGAFLLKLNSQGSLIWQKAWTGSNHTVGRAVTTDAAGDIYITGSIGNRALISKVSSSGAVLWQKIWAASTQGNAVATNSLGVAYIVGSFSFNNGTGDLLLLAFSSAGMPLWQRTWGGNSIQAGTGVAVDGFGNIYVSGGTGGNAVLLKFNATGSLLWQKTWRIAGSCCGISSGTSGISLDSLGNAYISGGTSYSPEGPTIGAITKLDSNGTLLWQRGWPGAGLAPFHFVYVNAIASDASGNVFVTGEDQNYNIILLELNSGGGLVSAVSWGVNAGVGGNSIALDNSDTPIIVGSISKAPSCCTQAPTDHTLSSQMPLNVTSAATAKNFTDLSNNLTVALVNANGSTSYAGNTDVFLNYGSSLPLPSLSPLQLLLLGGLLVVAGRRTSSIRRLRSSLRG